MTYEEAIRTIFPGRYRHFKGNEYEVIGISKHSETEEPMVVYRALYGDGGLWCRPASMWLEEVVRDGKTYQRFEKIVREQAAIECVMDLISRQAAIDALGERPMVWTSDDDYSLGERNQYDADRFAVETVPSVDAVEVVRCKDCYHYDEEHSRCLLNNSDFKPTDYCSYGSK